MAYEPYRDYLGLANVAWEKSYLETLMPPPACRANNDGNLITRHLILPTDPLDSIRCNATEDFLHNGVDIDLDYLDHYQTLLRGAACMEPTDMLDAPTTTESRRRHTKKEKKACVFCRNNGETPTVYKSHVLKDNLGRTTCPILRRYTCPLCRASGDSAHTIRYCPTNEGGLGSGLSLLLQSEPSATGSWPNGQ